MDADDVQAIRRATESLQHASHARAETLYEQGQRPLRKPPRPIIIYLNEDSPQHPIRLRRDRRR